MSIKNLGEVSALSLAGASSYSHKIPKILWLFIKTNSDKVMSIDSVKRLTKAYLHEQKLFQ